VLPFFLLACGTLSVSQEKNLGEKVEREIRNELVLVSDRVVVGYVERIGADILRVAGPQPFDFRFYVVEDEEINAFALPAGFLYVNTGTILKARNVSELAGVVAHEVGHAVLRHVAQNYNKQRTASVLHQLGVIGASIFGGRTAAELVNLGGGLAAVTVLNTFGREAEREADAFAVRTLPAAGYDPVGLLTFFETLREEGGARPPAFLSSHPAPEARIESTRGALAAQSFPAHLRRDDAGQLEIIQRRIRLLTGKASPRR
jgi:predicted Zn-dependent protease